MTIVCPYTSLRDETVEALHLHAGGHDIHYVDVSDHDEQLWETWQWVWQRHEDVIWVEHDIVITAEVLPSFEACDAVWCTCGYRYAWGNSDPYHGTGCVRIRSALMDARPDLWDRVAAWSGPRHPARHWCSLDGFMQLELAPSYRQCQHPVVVGHADMANSHGCLGTF